MKKLDELKKEIESGTKEYYMEKAKNLFSEKEMEKFLEDIHDGQHGYDTLKDAFTEEDIEKVFNDHPVFKLCYEAFMENNHPKCFMCDPDQQDANDKSIQNVCWYCLLKLRRLLAFYNSTGKTIQ